MCLQLLVNEAAFLRAVWLLQAFSAASLEGPAAALTWAIGHRPASPPYPVAGHDLRPLPAPTAEHQPRFFLCLGSSSAAVRPENRYHEPALLAAAQTVSVPVGEMPFALPWTACPLAACPPECSLSLWMMQQTLQQTLQQT